MLFRDVTFSKGLGTHLDQNTRCRGAPAVGETGSALRFLPRPRRVIGTSETPIIIVGNKRDLQRGRVIPRWNVSHLVRKTWKCGYVECSAKYNWHILLLFSELLKSVGCARCKHVHAALRFQGALRRNRCAIM